MSPNEKDDQIHKKGLTKGPRNPKEELEAKIRSKFWFTAEDGILGESEMGTKPSVNLNLDQVLFCVLVMRNGHRIVGINYGGVSRDNYDLEMARTSAYNNAFDQLWALEGYRLRDKLYHERNG